MKPCIFCPNPRTKAKGEHVWDDWLNRENGRSLKIRSTVGELGENGVLIREYPTRRINVTKDVVCDECNHEWMSDLTTHAKLTLEGFIRFERAATLLELGIVTIAAFAFMKAAVLDYSAENVRSPYFSPAVCHRFRASLQSDRAAVFLPEGFQVWIANYRSTRRRELLFWIDSFAITAGPFTGYSALVITYVVGAFVFQITYPRWMRFGKRRPGRPFLTQPGIWDSASIPIWPNVDAATWPPPKYLNGGSLQNFRERLKTILVPRRT